MDLLTYNCCREIESKKARKLASDVMRRFFLSFARLTTKKLKLPRMYARIFSDANEQI